jgi:hypothetical protein
MDCVWFCGTDQMIFCFFKVFFSWLAPYCIELLLFLIIDLFLNDVLYPKVVPCTDLLNMK